MARYTFQWITEQLAVGPAPLSYEDFDDIREAGINGIVNLGDEIAELSTIERQNGFEVYFLPIVDGGVPETPELEQALEWIDEALYLNKKILVHCRFGIGRTGTFVTTYLIRRGFGLKLAQKTLRGIRSVPTSFAQWRLLRKYDRVTPGLKVRKPDLRSRQTISLDSFFADYERIVLDLSENIDVSSEQKTCGQENDACCHEPFSVSLVEAAYIHQVIGSTVDQADRRAIAARLRIESEWYTCALSVSRVCMLFSSRPIHCRLAGSSETTANLIESTKELLNRLSRQLFVALTGALPECRALSYPMTRVLSGMFVRDYFAEATRVCRTRREK